MGISERKLCGHKPLQVTMMRVLLIMALVAILSLKVDAIVCTPNICDQVRCDNSDAENCTGDLKEYRQNGGFCGCCPLCITYIQENGHCLHLLGLPQKSQCISGTTCQNNTCQAVPAMEG